MIRGKNLRKHNHGIHPIYKHNKIVATFGVGNTSSAIQILGSSFDISQVSAMYIDKKPAKPTATYQFSTYGNHEVVYIFNDNPTTCYNMFRDCIYLTGIDLSHFDASDVTNMSYMFYGCKALTSIDFYSSNNDMPYLDMLKVTTTAHMFRGCEALTTVTGLDDVFSEYVGVNTTCTFMFYGCTSLVSIDLSYFVTSSVTTLTSMFQGCSKLTTVVTDGWDASKVTAITSMFRACSALTTAVNVGHLDWGFTTALTNVSSLFRECTGFKTWSYPANVLKGGVTNMSYLLDGCTAFTTTSLGGTTTAVTNMSYAFRNCSSLTSVDVTNWNWAKVTNTSYMFSGCTKLTSLKVGNYYPTSAPTRTSMFASITTSGRIILPSASATYNGWYNNVFNGYKPSSWTYQSY